MQIASILLVSWNVITQYSYTLAPTAITQPQAISPPINIYHK